MPTRVTEAFGIHTLSAAKGEADTIPIPNFGTPFGLMHDILERAQTSRAHPKLLRTLRDQLERLHIALYGVKQRVDTQIQQFSVGSSGRSEIECGLPRAVPLIARINTLNEELEKAYTLSLSLSRATWISKWLFNNADSVILRELNGVITKTRDRFQSDGGVGIDSLVKNTLNDLLGEYHIFETLTSGVDASSRAASTTKQHCWDGVGEALLEDIQSWTEGRSWQGKRVVFLRGAAGTGKSTLAVELCRRFEERNTLGASFFFSRTTPSLDSTEVFFASLAVQLATFQPALRDSVVSAARSYYLSEHGRAPQGSQDQLESSYQELFKNPLSSFSNTRTPLVIIVDAIDECTQQDAVLVSELLLRLLQGSVRSSSAIRILITSRPEHRYVGEVLNSRQFRDSIQFIDMPQPSPHDIQIFMQKELSTSDWSRLWCIRNPTVLKQLADEAHGWFLYARIAVLFLLSESPSRLDDPVRHLASEEMSSRLYTALEDIHATELKDPNHDVDFPTRLLVSLPGYIPDPSESDVLSVTPRVLGLLTSVPHTHIMDTLATFRSILVYDPFDADTELRFIHPACRGFLARRTSSSPVRVTVAVMGNRLTVACARIILDSLGPSVPFVPPSLVEITAQVQNNSPATLPDPGDLHFAYTYIRTHLSGRSMVENSDEDAALLKRFNGLLAIGCVRAVLSYLDSNHTSSLFVDFGSYAEENIPPSVPHDGDLWFAFNYLRKHPVEEELLQRARDEENAALITRFIDVVRDMLDDLYLWLFVAPR